VGGLTPSPTFSPLRCLIWTLLCGVEYPDSATPSAEEMRALPPHDLYRDFASTWAYVLLAHLSNGDLGRASPSKFLEDRLFLSELATAEYFGCQSNPQNAGHVSSKPEGPTHSRLLNRLLRGLWRLMPAVSGGQSLDHFVRAFAAETILEGRFGHTTAAQLSKTLAPYLALDRDRDASDIRGRFHRIFQEMAPLRRFFLLQKGKYTCMGPTVSREGDVVAMFFGASMPYALRPVDDGGGRKYMLLGECYVYGIMNGEYEGEMRRRFGDLAAAAEIFPLR
jgi:hypothetical protein